MAVSGEQLSELMSAYLDGEIHGREKAIVEAALRSDPAARKLLEELRRTVAVVGSLPRHGAPPDLAEELDARLERAQLLAGFRDEPAPASAPTSWRNYLRAAAMLGFVLAAGWWFLATQQKPSSHVAKGPSPTEKESPKELRSASAETVVAKPDKVETETLLARGTDAVLLVNHSFDVEPVRIRITARNASERDMLTRKFAEQLAQAHTENLAHRAGRAKDNRSVGSFYLEGKPGVNFPNAQEKQILVRLPQTQAQQLIDKVVAGSQIPSDQFAIQVGPATIRGQENARRMLQGMTENAPIDALERGQPDVVASTPAGGRMSTGLLRTLEKIVGIQPALPGSRENATSEDTRTAEAPTRTSRELSMMKKESEESPATARARDSTESRDEGATERKEIEDSKKSESGSLVSRRYDAARSRSAEGDRAPTAEMAATPPRDRAIAGNFITIVVEFALPESQPPPRRDVGRLRS